jgi:MoaA/NifB/PqqE/SkfB family radical SAM enzyme
MCPRTAAGFETDLDFPVRSMSLNEIKTIFPESFVKQLKGVLFGGNFGDFITAPDGLDIVNYLKDCNPDLGITIHTNGSARPESWWARLGSFKNVTVGFDLDGLEDTHAIYRRNTNWHTIIKNAKTFMAAGGRAVWRFIHFDHNNHQLDECKKLAISLGFDEFETLYHGRTNSAVYNAKTGKYEYTIGQVPNVPEYFGDFFEGRRKTNSIESRINFYKSISEIPDKIVCEAQGDKSIYITVTGEVYPCCYLGHYPNIKEYTQPWQIDNFALYPLIQNNNAFEHGLETAVNWFNQIEDAWLKESYLNGRLYLCDLYCGKSSPIQSTSTKLYD